MKNVDQLLASLKEYGTVDSEGEFTVSLSEARRKLKQYHSSEPGRYILLLLSGGLAAGAERADIERKRNAFTIAFPGATLSEYEILQAMSNPRSVRPNSAASDLVMGIQGAFVQRAEKIEVRVSSGRQGSFLWTLRPDKDSSQPLPGHESRGVEITLEFDPSWAERLRGFIAGLAGYAGMSNEERLVDRFADMSLAPITINRQAVCRPIMVPVSPASLVVGAIPPERLGFKPDQSLASGTWKAALALGNGPITLAVNGVCYCRWKPSVFQESFTATTCYAMLRRRR